MVSARNAWNNDTPFGKRIRKEKKWLAFLEHLVSWESSNKGQKDNVVMINRARCRPVASFFYGITGRCNPRRRRTSTERDRRSKSLGGEGETRLSDTVLLTFWKTWIFLKFWHFKIEFLWQRQLCHYVRRCMCIRASEESFSCVASITFLPQKTADILNHAQRQRANSKNEQCISSSPLSTSGSEIHPL